MKAKAYLKNKHIIVPEVTKKKRNRKMQLVKEKKSQGNSILYTEEESVPFLSREQ
jgi:hypothetical protein